MADAPVFLAREDSFVAVAKAAGDLVIPDRFRVEGPTLFDRVKAALGGDLSLVHRLDRGTSGVLLFARTAEMQRVLSTAFEQGNVSKEYRALVNGVPSAESGRVDAPIAAGRKGRMKIAPGGKPSVTHWTVLERFAKHAWLSVHPETGRTHQIRVHLSSIEHPIAGDDRYDFSGSAPVTKRLALHAFSIAVDLPDRKIRIEAPVPADLEAVLAGLRAS